MVDGRSDRKHHQILHKLMEIAKVDSGGTVRCNTELWRLDMKCLINNLLN